MYNSFFYYENGLVKCESSFLGYYAAYLIKDGVVVEKQHYSRMKEKKFSWYGEGVYSVRFFFKSNDKKIKYVSPSFIIKESVAYEVDGDTLIATNLSEGDNFRLLFFNNQSDVTFITFNGTQSRKKSPLFALKYCYKKGYNLISVNQDGDSQYQDLSLKIFRNAVSGHLTSNNFTYGASLGGYCALYYGGVINANVISISPKNSAHPGFVKARFKGFKFKHQNLKDVINTTGAISVFYDPYKVEDVRFIDTLIRPYIGNADFYPLPHAGHQLLRYVKEVGSLTQLIDSLVEGKCVAVEKDVENSTYLAEKAWFLYKNDKVDEAKSMAERSMGIFPNIRAESLLNNF